MTVKATLAYGKSFHFYHEATDNNHVYLELEDVSYNVGYRRVMVAIPIDVWEVIRGLAAANMDLVSVSDEDLIKLVEEKVNRRLIEYEAAQKTMPADVGLLRFNDAEAFGTMDTSMEEQLAKGIEYYRRERARQREIVARMSQHKILDINTQQLDEGNK